MDEITIYKGSPRFFDRIVEKGFKAAGSSIRGYRPRADGQVDLINADGHVVQTTNRANLYWMQKLMRGEMKE